MSDVDAANKSKRAAERRRQRILAKSQARMSVVSGQGNIDSVNGENNSEKKPRRRRRQRPSFMTNSLESTSSAVSSNDNVDNEESLSSIKLEKTETEKGNKMPATANVVVKNQSVLYFIINNSTHRIQTVSRRPSVRKY